MRGKMKERCIVGTAAAMFPLFVLAVTPPWDGDKIVFEDGGTYTLDSDASASGLYFNTNATLAGLATLTLSPPAIVRGGGTVQVPLAGVDGMCITNAWVSSRTTYPQKRALLQIVDTLFLNVAATRPNTALALWRRARPAGHPAATHAA